jgi:TRAP-type uncharacterized transport system fused permease subunit
LPFLWVYNPALLLSGSGVLMTLWVVLNCAMAVIAFAAANIGFLRRPLAPWERGLLLAVAVGMASHLILYRLLSFIVGIAIFLLILRPQEFTKNIYVEGGN